VQGVPAPPILADVGQVERELRTSGELIPIEPEAARLQLAPAHLREPVAVHVERADPIELAEHGEERLTIRGDPVGAAVQRQVGVGPEGVSPHLEHASRAWRFPRDDVHEAADGAGTIQG